jgi:FKBP-type peptidyl-prolyl cis-trans isomerase FkpA
MRRIRSPQPNPRQRSGVLCAGALLVIATACGGAASSASTPLPPSDPAQLDFAPELDVELSEFERTTSGLYYQDVQVGDGPVARRTSRVWVRYVGWLPDGTVFDGNVGGEPYHARLGGNEVIRGWNEGIDGMRRGGIRKLVVPPALGYGSRGSSNVPPGATLVFLVELVDVG